MDFLPVATAKQFSVGNQIQGNFNWMIAILLEVEFNLLRMNGKLLKLASSDMDTFLIAFCVAVTNAIYIHQATAHLPVDCPRSRKLTDEKLADVNYRRTCATTDA